MIEHLVRYQTYNLDRDSHQRGEQCTDPRHTREAAAPAGSSRVGGFVKFTFWAQEGLYPRQRLSGRRDVDLALVPAMVV